MFFYDKNIKADFSLKSVHISGNIINNFAYITETQEYINEENLNKEIIYVFPLVYNSTITGFEALINNKKSIKGIILEEKKAQKLYNKAISEGNSAFMLNKLSNDTYKINLGQILKGDKIKIKISYIFKLSNIYSNKLSFHVPTIFGIKYTSPNASYNNEEVKLIEETNIERAKTDRKLNINLSFTFDFIISKINSPSHNIQTYFINQNNVNIKFSEDYNPDRDIIINFEFEKKFTSFLKYYTNNKGETFVYINYLIDPEKLNININKNDNKNSKKTNEYIFLIDNSGSMSGIKLEKAKETLNLLINNLYENSYVNVIFFNSNYGFFSPKSVKLNKGNLNKISLFINNLEATGGTEIIEPLKYALINSKKDANIIILTDLEISYVNNLTETIKNNLEKRKIITIGIDTCYNLMGFNKIQEITGINSLFIHPNEDPKDKVNDVFSLLNYPLIKNLELKVSYNNIENIKNNKKIKCKNKNNFYKIEFLDNCLSKNIYVNFPYQTVFKINAQIPDKIILSGKIGKEKFSFIIYSSQFIKEDETLEKLWVKLKIDEMEEYLTNNILSDERKKYIEREIINLSKKYNVLSKYTSFFAKYTRNKKGNGLPIPAKIASEHPYMWDVDKFNTLNSNISYKIYTNVYKDMNFIDDFPISHSIPNSLYNYNYEFSFFDIDDKNIYQGLIIRDINSLYKLLKELIKNKNHEKSKKLINKTKKIIKLLVKNFQNLNNNFYLIRNYIKKTNSNEFFEKIKLILNEINNKFSDFEEANNLKRSLEIILKFDTTYDRFDQFKDFI